MQGFLDLCNSFDSCTTATLTLFLFGTTPSYISLFPIALALSCRTLNVLASLICAVSGAGDRGGMVLAIPGTVRPIRCRRSNNFFSDTVLNISRAPI